MIEMQVKNIADEFIRSVLSVPEVIEYLSALNKYENNEEITSLTEKYYSLSADFNKKQYDGTLTEEEINELRRITAEIKNNPLNIELADKQNIVKGILQGYNANISIEISMDFAKLSAPRVC